MKKISWILGLTIVFISCGDSITNDAPVEEKLNAAEQEAVKKVEKIEEAVKKIEAAEDELDNALNELNGL